MKYKTITQVRKFTHAKKVKLKTPKYVFTIEGREEGVFLSEKQVASATGLSDASVLVGSELGVLWKPVGTLMLNGEPVKTEESIVDKFDFKLSKGLQALKGLNATDVSYAGELDFGA